MPSAMQTPIIAREYSACAQRLAEKRADPEWHAEYKKRQRKYYRTKGNFLPNPQLSRQRATLARQAKSKFEHRSLARIAFAQCPKVTSVVAAVG
jgi:hypothetical protein